MCGLFGAIDGLTNNLGKKRNALNMLIHRGPDQWGEWYDDGIYMGHRRLSILDLSESGRQPMQSGNIIVTVNGEIYNYLELKKELTNYSFKSKSDSEVLLHGYKEWGMEKLLQKIEGMYAMAIYDLKRKELYLARDRVGIKPLYYGSLNNQFTWASELKALVNFYGENLLEKDLTAVYDFYTYLYIPAPKTFYKNIFKLEPGHYLKYDLQDGSFTRKKYWELEVQENTNINPDEVFSQIKYLIEKNVEMQMMSDVPLGFFLSGGIDSSVVVGAASDHNSGENINTYTIGFDIPEVNENEYARKVSDIFGTRHSEKILQADLAYELLKEIPGWYDEPFGDTSAIPTYLVSEFAKKESTVVLTGDGGDEVFGGYKWYTKYSRFNNTKSFLPTYLLPVLSSMKMKSRYSFPGKFLNRLEYRSVKNFDLYAKSLGGLMNHEKQFLRKELNIPSDYEDYWFFKKFDTQELTGKKRLQFIDFHTYLPEDILTKVDRASMQVSLECRVPLLATDIIEFVFSLPENMIYSNGQLKGLLKLAYQDVLPAEILHRPKKGFSIPIQKWQNTRGFSGFTSQALFIESLFQLRK